MNPKGTKITFQQRLDESFQKFPHHVAIESGAYHITYSQLENKANCICNWIKHKGIAPECFIGICFNHSKDIIPVMIGILKARCVFVMMDTSLPRQRLLNLARITHLQIVFTCTQNKKILFEDNDSNTQDIREFRGVIVDETFYQNSHVSSSSQEPQIMEYNREDKIYIYFTSGSTGMPRAIVGKNKSLLHYIDWEIETFEIDKTFRFSQWVTPGFDAFLRDVFTPLCTGAVICIPPRKVSEMAGTELINWLNSRHIVLIHCVPSVFRLINIFNEKNAAKENFKALKMVVMSGEKIIPQELSRWFEIFEERIQLINLYGLTETTMTKTCYFISPADGDRPNIPVGKPIPGARVLILDENMQVCPKKFIGEIYIRTPFGTHGYYNDPQANKEKFIPNPFTQDPNDLLHKTGDLGRLLEDDNIEVLRRVDRQIKIRGVRVEPEEIENILLQHPNLAEVSVIGKKSKTGELFLCAYFVPRPLHPGKENLKIITGAELDDYLAMHLPPYMVPSFFIPLEKMPLTPNGKIDRSALPEPPQEQDQYVPPANETETKLAAIWSQILDIDKNKISIDANFFRLGGHSLNAAILMSRIHNQLDIKIPLAEIFNNPTIRSLTDYMNTSMLAKNTFLAIEPVETREYYPLSSAQKRLYFLQQWDPSSIAYNMPMVQSIGNSIDLQALEAAMHKLIARHETLRTSFIQWVDIPFQKVHGQVPFKIEYYDLATKDTESTEKNIYQLIQSFIRPFDLSQAPLLRSGLIRTTNGNHIWLVDIHHIVTDGTSQAILIEDFFNISQGKELAPLGLQYKDFSQWQNSLFESGTIKAQQDYWLAQLSGEIPRLNLPADYKRPTRFTFAGTNHSFILEAEETLAFRELGNKLGATLYMNILAVLNVLFYKYTGQTDIIIGSGIAGRPHADLQDIVGMFVNILVMRNYPCGEKSYDYFLKEVCHNSVKNFENQDVQFDVLVEKINPGRDPSRNPVFDVAMMVQNFMEIKKRQVETTVAPSSPVQYKRTTTKSDLTFFVNEMSDQIRITIEYYTGIFKEETIQRLAAHFKAVVKNVIENPSIPLEDISILSEEEKQQILLEFNDTERDYPKHKTIHQLFEEQAEKTPDRIAVFGHGRTEKQEEKKRRREEEKDGGIETLRATSIQIQMSYRQLNEKSNQLAAILIEKGVLADNIVGIMMERSIEMVTGIIGILKAGAAYLPFDPDYPQERINYMLKDSGAKLLAVANELEGEKVGRWEGEKIFFESIIHDSNHQKGRPRRGLHHSNLAYIIYTSGTTGKPKGVMVEHGNIFNTIFYRRQEYKMGIGDRTLQLFSFVFDGFLTSFFTPVVSGVSVVLLSDDEAKDIVHIKEIIITQKITHFICVPSLYRGLLDIVTGEEITHLKVLTLAGEQIQPGLVEKSKQLNPMLEIINEYGPTENSVLTSIHRNVQPGTQIPIGRPIANTRIYIIDKCENLLPIGIPGQLAISGKGVARGYLNNPELTNQKFLEVQEPFFKKVPGPRRVYQTGDLARWLNDGNIEFLGRIDHQVKIRGFRIELGEIESQLVHRNDIKEAVVLAQDDHLGNKYLCAYFVSNKECSISGLREYLAKILPDYMLPSYFVKIEKIPLTSSGKIDRKALPRPELNIGESYTAPRNDIEKKLVEVWAEILGRDSVHVSQLQTSIGIDDHFFQVGGHSLKATVLATRIKKEWNVYIPLAEIFKNSTIRGQANYVRSVCGVEVESSIPPDEKLVQLKIGSLGSCGSGNLFLIHDGTGEVEGYLEFCENLKEHNCWGIRAERLENFAPRHVMISELAKNYIAALKKIQPQGPYSLAGWSLGGIIAFEMALQLEQAAEKLTMLTLFDSPLPPKNASIDSDDTQEFNLQTECEFIKDYVGSEFMEKLNCATGITFAQFWPFVIDYLQDNHFDVEDIKKIILEYGMAALPNYENLGLEEAIYYLNVGRTLFHARARYTPTGKIKAPIHYIEAEKTGQAKKIKKEAWNEFTTSTVTYYTVPGDHYSIFQHPQVKELAILFNEKNKEATEDTEGTEDIEK